MPWHGVHLSVHPFHSCCFEMNKHILRLFSPSGSSTILVFLYEIWRNSDGVRHNVGIECRCGMKKIAIFNQYIALSRKQYKIGP